MAKRLESEVKRLQRQIEEIEEELILCQNASIEVRGTIYPDVDMVISDLAFKTKKERSSVKFKVDDGRIVVVAPVE